MMLEKNNFSATFRLPIADCRCADYQLLIVGGEQTMTGRTFQLYFSNRIALSFVQLLLLAFGLDEQLLNKIGTTQSFTLPHILRQKSHPLPSNMLLLVMSMKNEGSFNRNVSNDNDVVVCKRKSPCIAIVTEPDACDSDVRYEATMQALYHAISTEYVYLISIRLSRRMHLTGDSDDDVDEIQFQSRYIRMIQQLREWCDNYKSTTTGLSQYERRCYIVVSSGPYMEIGLRHYADGVHFKEMHQSQIPSTRQFYHTLLQKDSDDDTSTGNQITLQRSSNLLVGTSVHSMASAMDAYTSYQPDYMFVGTCYTTQSHPDKLDVEGPLLPSQVYDALHHYSDESQQQGKSELSPPPLILGIGGINDRNCGRVVNPLYHGGSRNKNMTRDTTSSMYGTCDGVAVIRSVLQSIDPAQTVRSMYHCMEQSWNGNPSSYL
jgi:thiamine monophosphate synthase